MTPALAALFLALQAPTDAVSTDAPALRDLAVLQAGDDACGLFTTPQRALLDAAIARASDDAVLAGDDPEALRTQLARQTLVPACSDTRLAGLARDHLDRVDHLARFTEIRFEGGARHWISNRRPPRAYAPPRWLVHQATGAGDAIFGLAEVGEDLTLALAFNGHVELASATLVVRDGERQADPIDFSAGGLLPPPGRDAASAWGPAASASQRFVAQSRLNSEAAASLAPASGQPARGFEFSLDTLTALTTLTPREGIAIELRDRTGDVSHVIWFEVGSFQAALAMQAIKLIEPDPGSQPPAP